MEVLQQMQNVEDASNTKEISAIQRDLRKPPVSFLNKDKTSILFSSNTREVVKMVITNSAGATISDSYERYLGLLALVGKSKYQTFCSIKERV